MGNQNSGRRPSPTVLKVLRGTQKDRINQAEPKPPPGDAVAPGHLSRAALAIWGELAPICLAMGTLTIADVPAFARLCELEATAQEASRQKDAPGFAMFTLSEDYNGAMKVGIHAAVKVERETSIALRPYYDYFGMTPASRSRLHAPAKAEETPSKWAGILK